MDSTFKPALQLMAGRIVAFAATFFIPIVLVRIFEPAEFGTYKQLFLIFGTVYMAAQVGMAESLYYFIPKGPERTGSYVANSVLCLGLAGAAASAALYLGRTAVAGWLSNGDLVRYMPWVAAILVFTLASALFEIVLISTKRIVRASLMYGLSDLVRAALLIVPAVMARDLAWVLIGGTAFAFLRLLIVVSYIRGEFRERLVPDGSLLKSQLAYALPFGLAGLVEIVQLNYHHYAVSYHFDAAIFAVYAVGCLNIPLVDFLAGPTANVMMVRMSEKTRDGDSGAVVGLWHDATRKLALVFFPLVVFVIIAAEEIIVFLFTDKYIAAVPIFMVWSLVIIPSTFPTDGVLRVFAQTRFLFLLNLMRLALIAGLIAWFISSFALAGAAAVTVLALGLSKLVALVRIRSLLGVSAGDLLPWADTARIGLLAVLAGVPMLLVRSEVNLPLVVQLMVEGIVFAFAYAAALLTVGPLTAEERSVVIGWYHRWRMAD